jgi:signal transduction histidine kinase
MTSLPIALPDPAPAAPVFGEDEKFLLQAFRSFAQTADSLERSYGMLRAEVTRLRAELAQSNAGLARSLEVNRTMREHLDRILDGLPCGVLVVGAGGRISRVNPEGRRLLGSLCASAALETDSLAELPVELRDVLDRARCSRGECEHGFREAGEKAEPSRGERWLALRHAAVADHERRSDGDRESIFILRDVTDAKRLMREREKLRREQALAEMSAILAHEIRNPLGSLELFAGLLAASDLPPECRGWVEHVQAGLRTLGATVNNVLHFHSLPAPERALTDLGSVLDWAEGFLAPVAREAGVELRVQNRLQGVCYGADRHRLEQVLLNLVLNALRVMPDGGRVEIGGRVLANEDSEVAEISVSDTGPGLRADQLEKIFEAGFSTRAGSPGLGLTVCRKIVQQHGGTLWAENRAAGGARFTVRFVPSIPPLPKEGKGGEPTESQGGRG